MNRRISLRCLRLTVLALGMSLSTAYAAHIDIKPGLGDNVVAMLDSESILFTDAYRAAITEKGLTFNNKGRGTLTRSTQGTTVARMEYVYTKEGREYSRYYYARSGPAMGVVFERIEHQPPGSGSGTGTGTEGETGTSNEYTITEDHIKLDETEATFYPKDTAARVRAPNLTEMNGGVVANVGKNAGDAELKIFRKIESDIATKVVPRGGRLVGYVSKAVCPSCEAASRFMAERYDIDGNIYQLLEGGSEPSVDPVLAESHKSSKKLTDRRRAYVKNHLTNKFVPLDNAARIAPDPVERLEAEETREAAAKPCGV